MLYIDHGKGGPADLLKPAQRPVPQPQAGEVVIEVHYAGVNRPNVFQRSGQYPPPPGSSPFIGLEVAGRVSAVAADVKQCQVGDLVCALTPGGGFAENGGFRTNALYPFEKLGCCNPSVHPPAPYPRPFPQS